MKNFYKIKKTIFFALFLCFFMTEKGHSQTYDHVYSYTRPTSRINVGDSFTLNNFSNCQNNVVVTIPTFFSQFYDFSPCNIQRKLRLYVNNVLIASELCEGSSVTVPAANLPVNSIKIELYATSSAGATHVPLTTISTQITVTSPNASMPVVPTVSNVSYSKNAVASPLIATLAGTGTILKWYSAQTGGLPSSTAPTPSTATVGSTSYWVTSTNANGCESARKEIVVTVALPATHLNFDGANDNVTIPSAVSNAIASGSEVTIEYWFKGNILQSAVRIQNGSNYIVAGWGGSNPQFIVSTDGETNGVSNGTESVIEDNTWHHIACVWKKNEIFATYLDGVLQNSRVAANVNLPNLAGTEGKLGSLNGGSEFMSGNLDEVRIWNIARTPSQIFGSKNCELQGNESGLVAYYKFNQGLDAADNTAITSLLDATVSANNGTLFNFAKTGTTSNFLSGSPVTTGSIIPSVATVTSPVTYTQGATATALTATVGANGSSLVWYTTATGGTGTTAPTPSTTNPGNTSYWVASTNANGCESARTEIVVTINASTTPGCWAKITSSRYYKVAIAQNGTLWAWGRNNFGQLGDGTSTNRNTPTQIGTATTWQSISSGYEYTVAIKTDGTFWAWGRNDDGQLGDGTTTNRNTPTQIGTATTWQSVACGYYHTVAIKTDGTLWAWGYNYSGRLGDGTTTNRNTPTQIGTATTWQSISGASNRTVAIKTDGTLWAWGENIYGELGDGTTTNRNTPTQIGTANNWQSISSISGHTVAIKTDGTLWAWGGNNSGQLGDGTSTSRNTPTQIGTATTWQRISTGYFHTVAIKTDGTLWAWGYNFYGQLGDGTTINKNTPTQIDTATNWKSVSGGSNHTVAIKTDGTLWSWGINVSGQLGLGDTTDRNSPTEVTCPSVLGNENFEVSNNIKMYPNPTNNFVMVEVYDLTNAKLQVVDITGKILMNQALNISSNTVDVTQLPTGMYFFKVTSNEGTTTNKIIKN